MDYLSPGGGIAASLRFGAEQLCVFSVDQTGALNVFWVGSNGPWQGPMKISQPGLTKPGANLAVAEAIVLGQVFDVNTGLWVTTGAPATDVFLFDANGQLNIFSAAATLGWSGPQMIGAANAASPGAGLAACSQANGNQIDVFFIDTNGHMNVASAKRNNPVTGLQWTSSQTIGPSGLAPSGAPVAAIQQTGTQRTSAFVVGQNGQLYGFWMDGSGGWSGPNAIGPTNLAPPGASIAVCPQVGSTRTDVFLFGVNGELNLFWQDNADLAAGWKGPQSIGQAGFTAPGQSLVATQQFGAQQTDVVATDQSGHLWYFWVDGTGTWNGPGPIVGSSIVYPGGGIAAAQQVSVNRTDVMSIDANGDLNIFWVDGNGAWEGPRIIEDPVPEPPGGYRSSANYIYANGQNCANLTGVKATVYFTEDLIWQSSQNSDGHPTNGFSIQLNAETQNQHKVDWLQFVVHGLTELYPWTNIWATSQLSSQFGGSGNQYLWKTKNTPLTRPLPGVGRIPAGWSIIIELVNDSQGRITEAKWSVLDDNNNSQGKFSQPLSAQKGGAIPSADLCPVASFQVTFGGDSNGDHATFSSGAGLIILEADQRITVETAYPSCIGFISGTAETSNIGYGALSATPSTMFSQPFSVLADGPSMHIVRPGARKSPPIQPAH